MPQTCSPCVTQEEPAIRLSDTPRLSGAQKATVLWTNRSDFSAKFSSVFLWFQVIDLLHAFFYKTSLISQLDVSHDTRPNHTKSASSPTNVFVLLQSDKQRNKLEIALRSEKRILKQLTLVSPCFWKYLWSDLPYRRSPWFSEINQTQKHIHQTGRKQSMNWPNISWLSKIQSRDRSWSSADPETKTSHEKKCN